MAKITFTLDDGQELVLPISGRISIGRAEGNDVVVDDKRMSKHHADLLLHADGSVEVFDQNSTAGTLVNDQPIVSHVLLHGDRIAFGPLSGIFDMESAVIDNAALLEQQSAIAALKAQREEKATELERLTLDAAKAQTRLDAVRRDCLVAETSQREHQAAIKELELQREQKATELGKLADDAAKAQTRLNAVHRDCLVAETTQREQQAAIKELELQRDQKTAAIKKLTEEADKAQARLEALTSRQIEENTRLEALSRELSQVEKRTLESQTIATRQQEQSLAAEAALALLTTACTQAEVSQRELQSSVAALTQEHDQRAAALAKITAETLKAQTQSEEQRRAAEASLALLKVANTQAEASQRDHQASVAALTEQHGQKAAALAQLTEDVEKAQARLDSLTTLHSQENKRLEATRQTLTELQTLTARQQEQSRANEASLALLQVAATQAEAARVNHKASIESLTLQHAEKVTELEQLTSEASQAQSLLETLTARQTEETKRLEQVQAAISQEKTTLAAMHQEVVQIEVRIKEGQKLAASSQDDVRAAEEALKRIQKRHQDAEAKVQELERVQKQLADAEKRQTILNNTNSGLNDEQQRKIESLKQLQTQITAAEGQLAAVRKKLTDQTSLVQTQSAADVPFSNTPTIEVKSTRNKIFLRCFMLVLPLTLLAVAGWAAQQSQRGRLVQNQGVVGMLSEPVPALHPYSPRTEAERQIIDLVHEPLMRIGTDGTLQPALAELWRWSQDVTCWFADAETAKRAQESLQAQIGEKNLWAEWHLSTVRILGSSLVLNFSDPTSAGTPEALAVIAPFQPQVVSFWRVETDKPLKAAAEQFLAQSLLASQIRRTWFDQDKAFEIVTVGPAQKVIDELRSFIHQQTQAEVRVRLFAEVAALSEPVLDLDLRHGQTWHDGSLVTAEDVKTTIEQVNQRPWLLPNREALRHIQQMEIQNEGHRLRVTFRSRYGPALCGWAGLPVLPAAWWREHAITDDATFARFPPPGAGPFRISKPDARTLSLTPTAAGNATSFLFHFGASPLMTQIGLGTHTTQLAWPAATPENQYGMRTCLTPPHRRRVVLWNTRSGALADVRVRHATAMSTDVAAIIAAIPGRHSISDASLFPPGMWLHTQSPRPTFALTEAKKILKEAGWLIGVDGVARNAERRLEFNLLLVGDDPESQATAQLLVSQWQQLGIKLTIETLAKPDQLAQRLAERRFDAALLEQQFEVSWDQFPWWHSSQAKPGGSNYAGIQDPQTDLLLEALSTEFEPAAAAARVREVEARLLPLHPMLTLFDTVDDTAVQADLIGGQSRSAWTLRQLALQPTKATKGPQFDLKLPDE